MEELVKLVAHYVSIIAEGVAVLFIIDGIIGSVWIYGQKTYFVKKDYFAYLESRNHLGHTLSLSLEFLIGADILKTAISPTWEGYRSAWCYCWNQDGSELFPDPGTNPR